MKGIIFCHGWASHPNFWDNLKQYFLDIPCIFWDLGYFSPINCSLPNNQELSEWVGIGHSLGFLKLLQSSLPLKAFIVIQGFTNFIGHDPKIHQTRRKELHTMITYFNHDPGKVVSSFQKRCNLPKNNLNNYMDINLLLADLMLLEENFSSHIPHVPFLILGSQKDMVVPSQILYDNFGNCPNVSLIFHENAGHDLGYYDHEFTYEHIHKFLKAIQ